MDNSQSSDFFDESCNISCESQSISEQMDNICYKDLISNTKFALGNNYRKELKKPTFYKHISLLLDDCGNCVSQSLDLIISSLSETHEQVDKLVFYLTNTVDILQMLSDCIKTVIESVSMSCCRVQNFPTTTGHILMIVFMHCKESEELYGTKLKNVENQLKDLFKACHELQLTYLIVIEKSFAFDLSKREQLLTLVDALDINLKIGEIVQTLDIKTMAEQWKGLISIYEKYSLALMDKNIYNDCVTVLCAITESNLKSALQPNQDDKTVLRSFKVTGFTLKILVKVCAVFRNSSVKNQQRLVDLFVFINTYFSVLKVNSEKYSNVTNTYVLNPMDALLRELVLDEKFCESVLSYDKQTVLRGNKLMGFMSFLINVIKIMINENQLKISKKRIVDCIYDFLPHIQIINETRIEEVLLLHTTALALTMDGEEFCALEKHMIKAILSTECLSAMFSSNLWILLARMMPRQLLYNQLIVLCEMYQKLESNKLFSYSPQKVHMTHTIRNLFVVMHNDDKIRLHEQYSVENDRNISLWEVLGVKNLPVIVRSKVDEIVSDQIVQIQKCIENNMAIVDVDRLISTMNLAATCSIKNDRKIVEFVSKAWERVCPENLVLQELNAGTLWYFHYLEALITMTYSIECFSQSPLIGKICHGISGLIGSKIDEIQILLIDFIYNLAIEVNKDYTENIIQIYSEMLKDSTLIIMNIALNKLKYILQNSNQNINRIMTEIVYQDPYLEEMYKKIGSENKSDDSIDIYPNDITYQHKCIQNADVTLDKAIKKSCSSNFDFADIDTLFENESESEPACKKPKLNVNEADVIISRLENDVSVLCNIKENIFTLQQKAKIKNLCNKLQNKIDC